MGSSNGKGRSSWWRMEKEMEKGKVVVEKVRGKSTVTRSFSKYPLKFIIPRKVGPSETDAVWIYSVTYGGGIVSGDSISVEFTIGDGCTAVLTTQASTKVYKSLGSKCSEQVLEARIGSGALFAVIPDPVTCFSTARYSQKQVFRVASDSSLVIVDWFTSGRHESGEKWDFELYRSANHIFSEGNQPVFLDTVLLEKSSPANIAERMHGYQVIAMVIIYGPKLKLVQDQVQENVKRMMSQQLHIPSTSLGHHAKTNSDNCLTRPAFIASCSVFGPKGIGVVVRIASTTTESVYRFLQHQLAGMEPLVGVPPYH
ncbi:Urease accessory protein D isoform 1 [Theobroma cacao]|uniref:Urease accessory protein D isoform 1 n=1 Tax=Theobroma cacao TaxID=3641 RepID=A0A061DVY2_THECC|nr:Urease accessory protein D isoform 1 [Theobroma cacao]EOX96870.1 Urease accessory protein D isoform 1 [Theobroma cacao]